MTKINVYCVIARYTILYMGLTLPLYQINKINMNAHHIIEINIIIDEPH